MSVATFLEGLRSEVASGMSITCVVGFMDGAQEHVPAAGFACVYPEIVAEVEGDVYHEQIAAHIRVFFPAKAEEHTTKPVDITPLVSARDALIAALEDRQTADVGVWYFRIVSTEFFNRERFIDATVTGWQQAAFTAG